MKSDKGNGVIIVNRAMYKSSSYEIINDMSKCLKLPSNPTIQRKGKLQRFLKYFEQERLFQQGAV